jgi:chemotaxis signal transduction protein
MLRTHRGLKSDRPATVTLVVFTVGGKRLAARAEHVGGVRPWVSEMPVPSRTPFVKGILRQGEDLLPVFDLAGRFSLAPAGTSPWCLILKRGDGPVAVRIDGEMPQIQAVKADALYPPDGTVLDIDAVCRIGAEDVPVLSVATLGMDLPESTELCRAADNRPS